MEDAPDSPLAPLCEGWLKKIKLAWDFKQEKFQVDADECMAFFDGPYTWMYKRKMSGDRGSSFDYVPDGDDPLPVPAFQITINKAAELVQLFGPAMYQRNPNRQCNPRRAWNLSIERFGDPNDPATGQMVQQQYAMFHQQAQPERVRDKDIARLFEDLGNYTPQEMDLRGESRLVVDEALITGMSAWWPELVVHPSGLRGVGSFYKPIRQLVLDPDADRLKDCQWVALECCHPVWAVEREYGLPPGSLKGNKESAGRMMMTEDDKDENAKRARGEGTNDLLYYWKVWSKMGLGGRLKGVMDAVPAWKQILDQVGDYCFLAVAKDCSYPINVPPEVQAGDIQGVIDATQWPTPFWLDDGAWPFVPLVFHAKPGSLWPIPHLKPALGEIKFVNWVYSFLAGKLMVASRDFLVMLKSLSDETKRAIKHGPDYTVIEIEAIHADIDKIVKFIQHPTFNPEIYRVLEHMIELIDKRTGLSELLYGQTATQLRSAQEANVKQQNASIRPDDMAQQVEDACSELARREAAACRWHLTAQDVLPILGTVGAWYWETEVMQGVDPASMFHQFQFTVEAGSTRRPNKQRDAENLQNMMNQLQPLFFQWAMQSGDVGPFNSMMVDYCKSIGIDAEKKLLNPAVMQQMMMQQQAQAAAEQQSGGPPSNGGKAA